LSEHKAEKARKSRGLFNIHSLVAVIQKRLIYDIICICIQKDVNLCSVVLPHNNGRETTKRLQPIQRMPTPLPFACLHFDPLKSKMGSRDARNGVLLLACCFLTARILFHGLNAVSIYQQGCETLTPLPQVWTSYQVDLSVTNRSSNVPQFQVDPLYEAEYHNIDTDDAQTRCSRYGYKPYSGPPRRIFFGTMVAEDSWDVFRIHAVETYDVYHAAVFVESDSTHMAKKRKLRFKESRERDLLVDSGMFGNNTKVYLHYWLEDRPDLTEMDRESEQRNSIIKVWKAAGMTPEDVGLMADIDETFSRDFLRAVQTCDFPQFQPGQSCQFPKVVPVALMFETSPYCIRHMRWYHPDLISGECVEGIGDPTERVVPLRTHLRQYGDRHQSYGRYDANVFPNETKESNRYPLYNGPDIRVNAGARSAHDIMEKPGNPDTAVYGVAYHLHNWFDDFKTLRHKYKTYAHGVREGTEKMTVSQLQDDLDAFVRCMKDLGNDANPEGEKYYPNGWETTGPRPIFFLNKTYTNERHEYTKEMLIQDEKLHGSSYS
jgi:hypothetical protein